MMSCLVYFITDLDFRFSLLRATRCYECGMSARLVFVYDSFRSIMIEKSWIGALTIKAKNITSSCQNQAFMCACRPYCFFLLCLLHLQRVVKYIVR